MKNIVKFSLLLFAGGALIYAATIISDNFVGGGGGGEDLVVTDSEGLVISQGMGIAATGYFSTLSDTQVEETESANINPSLVGDFRILLSDNFNSFATDGLFLATGQYTQEAESIGKTLYTFIGNASTLEDSTEFALYRFPNSIDGETPTSPESDTLLLSEGTLVFGSLGPKVVIDTSNLFGDPNYESDSLRLQKVDDVQPPSGPIEITLFEQDGDSYKVTARNLDPAKSYTLTRNASLVQEEFGAVGDEFTGGASNTFEDATPLEGKAFYRVELVTNP